MDTVISRDGTRIACKRAGEGPVLVLVHGTSGSRERWAPVLPSLQARFTVVTMDRRGRGDSGDGAGYAHAREIEDVVAVVESCGEPVHLLGHSFGAICALEAALRTQQLRKLVLYEPPIPVAGPVFPDGTIARLEALLAGGDREAVLELFFREVNGMPPAAFAAFRATQAWPSRLAAAHTLPREMRAVDAYRIDPVRLAGLALPCLLLLGGDSPPYFRAAVEALAAALPAARTVVLPGQRHVAMDTAPELFVREVAGFLQAP